MKCAFCGLNRKYLSQHLKYAHNYTDIKKYYDAYLKKENEGICKRKHCKNSTKYYDTTKGYLDYCSTKCVALATSSKVKQTLVKRYGKDFRKKFYLKGCKIKLTKYGDKHYNNSEKISKSLLSRSKSDYENWKNKVQNIWKNKTKKELKKIDNKRNKTFIKKYKKTSGQHITEQIKKYCKTHNVINSSQIPFVRQKMTNSINDLYSDPIRKN
ncbi:hypothetical protein EBU95_20580 [bacterium]|nr:hypothetical protein [bacterium]